MEDIENFEKQMKETNESLNEEGDLTWEEFKPQVDVAIENYKKKYSYLFKDVSYWSLYYTLICVYISIINIY